MDFSELDLHPDLRRGIEEAGFVTAMPVQAMTYPHAFLGKDIYAQSQTGTGKTAAFLVSIFQRILTVPELRTRKVLVLAPTRELAVQIEGECEKLGKYLDIKCGAFYGGVSYGPQVEMLRDNVQVIIGTPGRVQDLVTQGKMLLKDVGFLVIDEADRMFDMGFIDDIRKLLRYLPKAGERQTFLYSATLGLRVKDLAWEYMVDPVEISIEPEHVTVDLVTQELYHVGSHEKLPLLLGLLEREQPGSAIIFCNQKFMTEELARRLKINGWDCEYIMGDLPQQKRLQIIEDLKAGKVKLLVATDVAARGLDIEALDLVINYDVPEDAESYVHRIGRTARAGKAGKAITLACEKFVFGLSSIEKFVGDKIPVVPVDPAMFGEDRSHGMRSGYGRDRGPARSAGSAGAGRGGRSGGHSGPGRGGESRGGHGGARQGEGRRDDARRGGPAAGGEAPRHAPAHGGARGGASKGHATAGSEGTRPQGQRPPRKPESAIADGARRGDTRDGVNPYAVSQEERMRQYKDKYSTGKRPGDARQGDGQREGGGKRGPGARNGGQQGQRGQQGSRNGQQRQPAPQKAAKPAPQAQGARKPGILDRIKGLFGAAKKKD